MNDDLISRSALKEAVKGNGTVLTVEHINYLIDNAPTVEYPDVKKIIDVIHKTIYQFFDVYDEETPISDKDKLLLEVNKAICNNLKILQQEGDSE